MFEYWEELMRQRAISVGKPNKAKVCAKEIIIWIKNKDTDHLFDTYTPEDCPRSLFHVYKTVNLFEI